MAKFNVLRSIVYDGEVREEGGTIDAPVEHMLHPLTKGYVEPANNATEKAVEEARAPDRPVGDAFL